VNQKQQKHLSEKCRCGKVKLEAVGRPILTASCYCASCQEAGSRFEQLPSAPPVLNPDGGTDYVLYRKDRVQCVTGQEYLEEHRLKPDSPTRRVIATCCNSGMFLDFTKGHWLTMYRNRFPAGAPPIEMRVMTQDRRDGVARRHASCQAPRRHSSRRDFDADKITTLSKVGFRRTATPGCLLFLVFDRLRTCLVQSNLGDIDMGNISAAGVFSLGGRTVNGLGYGAMQLAGPGVFGPPKNRNAQANGNGVSFVADRTGFATAQKFVMFLG
jgi:hypothetical protein